MGRARAQAGAATGSQMEAVLPTAASRTRGTGAAGMTMVATTTRSLHARACRRRHGRLGRQLRRRLHHHRRRLPTRHRRYARPHRRRPRSPLPPRLLQPHHCHRHHHCHPHRRRRRPRRPPLRYRTSCPARLVAAWSSSWACLGTSVTTCPSGMSRVGIIQAVLLCSRRCCAAGSCTTGTTRARTELQGFDPETAAELRGGGVRDGLYRDTKCVLGAPSPSLPPSPPPPPPSPPTSPPPASPLLCTSEPEPIGSFVDKADRAMRESKGSGFDLKGCAAACPTFTYIALQYYGECYCDNDWARVSKHGKSPTECGPTGIAWCNYVHRQKLCPSPPSLPAPPPSPAESPPPSPPPASPVDCTSEPELIGSYIDTPDRAMRDFKGSSFDLKGCASACPTFTYIALQYFGQCYCDNDWSHVSKHGESPTECGPTGTSWCNYVHRQKLCLSPPSPPAPLPPTPLLSPPLPRPLSSPLPSPPPSPTPTLPSPPPSPPPPSPSPPPPSPPATCSIFRGGGCDFICGCTLSCCQTVCNTCCA